MFSNKATSHPNEIPFPQYSFATEKLRTLQENQIPKANFGTLLLVPVYLDLQAFVPS